MRLGLLALDAYIRRLTDESAAARRRCLEATACRCENNDVESKVQKKQPRVHSRIMPYNQGATSEGIRFLSLRIKYKRVCEGALYRVSMDAADGKRTSFK